MGTEPRRVSIRWRCALALTLLLASWGCACRPGGGSRDGVVVESVSAWGSAAAAGLQSGDLVEAWRTATEAGTAIDPLGLLWVEADLAPRQVVTLSGRRGWRKKQWTLHEASWAMTWRPRLPPAALKAYERLSESGDPGSWDAFEALVADSPAAAWAAWKRGEMNVLSRDRLPEVRGAFERAQSAVSTPQVASWLQALEGRALWRATYHADSAPPMIAAAEALRQLDSQSPALGRTLALLSQNLTWQRRGDEALETLEEAERILERWPRARQLESEVLARRGSLAGEAGELEQAVSYYRSALEVAQDHHVPLKTRLREQLGHLFRSQGKFEQARDQFGAILAEIDESGELDPIQEAGANNSLGLLSKELGDYESADRYYRRALELFPAGGLAEAGMRNNLGNLAIRRGNFAKAEKLFRRSLELRLAIRPDSPAVASSYNNLGVLLRRSGQLEEARDMLEEALRIKASLAPESLYVASTLAELGMTQLGLGDLEHAEKLISRARGLAERINPGSLAHANYTLFHGDVRFNAGHPDQALALWQQGIDIVEKLRDNISGEQGKARFGAIFDSYYRNVANNHVTAQRVEQGYLTLETARARMLRALLRQHGDRLALAASPDILEARRRINRQISKVEGRLATLHPERDADRLEEMRRHLLGLEDERDELNEKLYLSVPGLERLERVPPISLQRIRQHLPPGSVGLFYSIGNGQSFVFVVHPATRSDQPAVVVVELEVLRDEIEQRIELYRGLLQRGATSPEIEPALIAHGHRLYQDLLAPVEGLIRPASQVFIAPDSPIASLPFAALVAREQPLAFFAEHRPHAIVPSLGSLIELLEVSTNRPLPEVELVAFGAPDLERRGSTRVGGLDPLPGALEEIERLERLFSSVHTFVDSAATEQAVRQSMPRGRYIHFATHALLDQRFPLSSNLVLSADRPSSGDGDGVLHGWEILQSPPLAADLVTLAGCETGRGAQWSGEGLIGLTQAFHYVGTPSILASQWRVGDAWVGRLSEAFYRQLLDGHRPMLALSRAQREMIASAGGETSMAHPFYWAAFTLFGVG